MSATSVPTLERTPTGENRLHRLCIWFLEPDVLIRVVLYLATLIYLRTIFFDYVYDDTLLTLLNPWMVSWKDVPAIFTHSFWGFLQIPPAVDFYRPMVMLALAAIYHILGPAPGWFHLMTAGLHVAATYLVYRFLSEIASDKKVAPIAAGIFGLHPTKVETAAWISGLSDSLSLVFFLISMIAYFRWRKGVEGKRQSLLISALFLLLALFSKEAAIFAPILIAIYEFTRARGGFRDRCRATLGCVWPFAAVTAVALASRILLVQNRSAQMASQVAPLATLLGTPQTILWYLQKQLWPAGLSIHYSPLVSSFSIARFVIPLLLLLGVSIVVCVGVRRKPTGIFFLSWFVLMLAPVILYQTTLQRHDRYFYFASVATSAALAWLIAQWKYPTVVLRAGVVFTLFAVMAALTLNYEWYWDNDRRLFMRAIQIAPKNPDAAEYLAAVYINDHQPEKAEAVAQTLIHDPDLTAKGWYILGTVRAVSEGNYDAAREALQRSSQLSGRHNFLANIGLAATDMNLGRDQEAAEIYREELKKYPNVAYLHGRLAVVLERMGRSDEAARELGLQKRLQ